MIIKNACIVTSKEQFTGYIVVRDGIIKEVAEGEPYSKSDADTVIDAKGKIVTPGGVDAHTHLEMPFMGTYSTDDFNTGTKAALYGGTTTIIDYIIPKKNQTIKQAFVIWQKKAENKAYTDYSFHLAIVPPIGKMLSEFESLKKLGISSIKCFLAYKDSLMLNKSEIEAIFEEAQKNDILVCIHAEEGEQIDANIKELISEGKTDPIYHAISRPSKLEAEAVSKVLKIAKKHNSPVYFVHTSTAGAISEIKEAQAKGQKVYIETCPQYLYLTEEKYKEDNFGGAKYVMSPPLRAESDVCAIRNAIKENRIDVIATDHCPFNMQKEKLMGLNDFTKIPNGIPCIELRMPLIMDFYIKNNLPLTEFVKTTCTNPAKIFGLNSKGDLVEGMDADLVIWDTTKEWKISVNDLHENVDYTPFEEITIHAKAETVVARGKIALSKSTFNEKEPKGKMVPIV